MCEVKGVRTNWARGWNRDTSWIRFYPKLVTRNKLRSDSTRRAHGHRCFYPKRKLDWTPSPSGEIGRLAGIIHSVSNSPLFSRQRRGFVVVAGRNHRGGFEPRDRLPLSTPDTCKRDK